MQIIFDNVSKFNQKMIIVWKYIIDRFDKFKNKSSRQNFNGTHQRPKISVIIPTFNNEKYLPECLNSILSQSFRQLEVICVNDDSTDQTSNILKAYSSCDARIIVLTNTQNQGPGLSRNKGLSVARGEYVIFVDGDDLLGTEALTNLYSRAIRDNVELVKGSLAAFRKDNPDVYEMRSHIQEKENVIPLTLKDLWIPYYHTSFLIKTNLLRKFNIKYPDLIMGEDPVFLAKVLVNARSISTIEQLVYLHRRYEKTSGSLGNTFNHLMDFIKHVSLVKTVYDKTFFECWEKGYCEFILKITKFYIKRTTLTLDQKNIIKNEGEKIWGDLFELC